MTSKTRKTLTVVRYLVASVIPVALAWVYELGKEGFNSLLANPGSNRFSWFVLLLACAQAMCQAVGALLNSDLGKTPPAEPNPYRPPGKGGPP